VPDKPYNIVLPFVDFGQFRLYRFGGFGGIDMRLVDIGKRQFYNFTLFQ
jgi:hypothetical protein